MLTYRDMTFCPFFTTCTQGNTCRRALTLTVQRNAAHWKMPVCQYGQKPECYKGLYPERETRDARD